MLNWDDYNESEKIQKPQQIKEAQPVSTEQKVETAEEMFKATQQNLPTDIAIFTAAVSDFKIQKKHKSENSACYLLREKLKIL